jgi:hypothetical protein
MVQSLLDPKTDNIIYRIIGDRGGILTRNGEAHYILLAECYEPETALWLANLANLEQDIQKIQEIMENEDAPIELRAGKIFEILERVIAFRKTTASAAIALVEGARKATEKIPRPSPQKIS